MGRSEWCNSVHYLVKWDQNEKALRFCLQVFTWMQLFCASLIPSPTNKYFILFHVTKCNANCCNSAHILYIHGKYILLYETKFQSFQTDYTNLNTKFFPGLHRQIHIIFNWISTSGGIHMWSVSICMNHVLLYIHVWIIKHPDGFVEAHDFLHSSLNISFFNFPLNSFDLKNIENDSLRVTFLLSIPLPTPPPSPPHLHFVANIPNYLYLTFKM